jgi:hypothetical protein
LNVAYGFQINTSGDAIEVDFNQFEALASTQFASSPMASAGAARASDVLTYPFAGNALAAVGTCYVELSTNWSISAAVTTAVGFSTGADILLFQLSAQPDTAIRTLDGAVTVIKSGLTSMSTGVRKRACSWGSIGQVLTGDGSGAAISTFDGAQGSTAIGICCTTNGANTWNGTAKNLRISPPQLSAAQLQAMTTP